MSKRCPKVRFLTSRNRQLSRVDESVDSYFWTDFRKSRESPKKSRKSRNLENLQKSQKSAKSTKSAKSRKSAIFGTLARTIQDLPKSTNLAKVEFLAKSWIWRIRCPDTKKVPKSGPKKVPKKSQIFAIFDPPKKSKKWSVCRGNDASQMAAYFNWRRQKNRHFLAFLEGKGKKCTFFGNFERFSD